MQERNYVVCEKIRVPQKTRTETQKLVGKLENTYKKSTATKIRKHI